MVQEKIIIEKNIWMVETMNKEKLMTLKVLNKITKILLDFENRLKIIEKKLEDGKR